MTKHIEFHSIDEFMIELCSEAEVAFDFGEFINGSLSSSYCCDLSVDATFAVEDAVGDVVTCYL